MATERYYVPLDRQVAQIWPHDLVQTPDLTALERIWIAPAEIRFEDDVAWLESGLLFEESLEAKLPGVDGISLSLGTPDLGVEVALTCQVLPTVELTIGPVPVALNILSDLLVPAEEVNPGGSGPKRFEPRPSEQISLLLGDVRFKWEMNGDIEFLTNIDISLPPVFIGETGIVVEAGSVRPVLAGARALHLDELTLYFPEGLADAIPTILELDDFLISAGGISGTVTGNWDPPFSGDILGIPFSLKRVAIELQQNVLVGSDIEGEMEIPYFQERVAVRVNLLAGGVFNLTLSGVDDGAIRLTKDELLALHLQSISVTNEGNVGEVVVSGGLEPLLMGSDGLEWPRLDVRDLSIDTTGRFRIREAWLDLKDLATLDLWGFHFELSRIGLGYEDARDRLWVDLSGSLRLIEQIPIGLGVEGFRLTWPRTLLEDLNITAEPTLDQIMDIAAALEVRFDGVYLFYGVPNAVEFEGFIRFIKEAQKVGFAGDIALRVPATGFSAEAGLMVGMNFENPPYPFLYVYLGVELPAGIPLGQSGLALKGALGLFGLNVCPDRTPEQNWYYDWYKRGPIIGAHPTNKWRDERNAFAVGLGVTVTTVDGYIKGVRGLVVLVIPGPILVLEGKALLFNGLLPAEPPLRALAIFDGQERTVQFNVEAEAELIEDLLRAYGTLEAFFDFEDLTNWHLYLGQDEPADRRIQANILRWNDQFLFDANAYLMLDMIGGGTLRTRMGVFVGFRPTIPELGPVKVEVDATFTGNGVVTVLPEQFSGDVQLSASASISAFGFSAQFTGEADVLTEGPDPFKIDAALTISAELPQPLEPFETTLEFSWESPPAVEVTSPLTAVVAESNFTPGGGLLRIYAAAEISGNRRNQAEGSPVVPVDARPTLIFDHDMNDGSGGQFRRDPDGRTRTYDVGLMRFTPTLTRLELFVHRKRDPWPASGDGWTKIATTVAADGLPLWGTWLADAVPDNPSAPAARRLRLWTEDPLVHALHALGVGYRKGQGLNGSARSYGEGFLDAYPNFMVCDRTVAQQACVDYGGADPKKLPLDEPWLYQHITITAQGDASIERRSRRRDPLGADRLRELRTALRGISSLAGGGAITEDLLIAWGEALSNAERQRLRRSHRNLDWLWRWLWQPPADDVCLLLDGPIQHLRFPQAVRSVTIRFCDAPQVPASDARSRLRARRVARTADEIAGLVDKARAKGSTPDFVACAINVAHDLNINGAVWTVESDEAFECLELVRLGSIGIGEICYLTEAERARAELAAGQCEANEQPFPPEELLESGAYYRLVATTQVEGALRLDDLSSGALGQLAALLYEGILEGIGLDQDPEPFTQESFFQTEGPPSELSRYVKWSHPLRQATRVFCEDDLAIRFRRPYLHQLFPAATDPLRIVVRDAEGHADDLYQSRWLKAGSATVLPEERLWLEHRQQNPDDPQSALAHDDVLEARLPPRGQSPSHPMSGDLAPLVGRPGAIRVIGDDAPALAPRARYELLVVRDNGSQLDDDHVLYQTTFTTSAYRRFADLVGSFEGRVLDLDGIGAPLAPLNRAPLAGALDSAWRAQVDFRDELLDRAEYEAVKLALRDAKAAHDAAFRSLAGQAGVPIFDPQPAGLTVFRLRTGAQSDSPLVGLWIRSPESLDFSMGAASGHRVGRTSVTIDTRAAPAAQWTPSSWLMAHDADSTELLVYQAAPLANPPAAFRLNFTYARDLGDEATVADHRYDRSIERRSGSAAAETAVIEF